MSENEQEHQHQAEEGSANISPAPEQQSSNNNNDRQNPTMILSRDERTLRLVGLVLDFFSQAVHHQELASKHPPYSEVFRQLNSGIYDLIHEAEYLHDHYRHELHELFMLASCHPHVTNSLRQITTYIGLFCDRFLIMRVDCSELRILFRNIYDLNTLIFTLFQARQMLSILTVSQHHVKDGLVRPICQTEFVLGEKVNRLPCHPQHIFHYHCIMKWVEAKNTCPVCRATITKRRD